MSLVQSAMINKQKFTSGHMRSRSYNELLTQFKGIADGGAAAVAAAANIVYKKRSREAEVDHVVAKRSRTAPPSPPSPPYETSSPPLTNSIKPAKYSKSLRSRSLSPNKRFFNPISPSSSQNSSPVNSPHKAKKKEEVEESRIKLPGISSVLNSALPKDVKLKPIAPTVSLDYFDTYKPNDENWRYELLDTINRGSKHFNLNQYNYLNSHRNSKQAASPTSSSSSAFSQHQQKPLAHPYKPSFDSRISSKIAKPPVLPSINQIHHSERKINFPYESSYTYLNKTYLNDVEKYPEYLELAQSLISLSRPKTNQPVQNPVSPHQESASPELRQTSSYTPQQPPYTANVIPPITTAPPNYYLPPQGAFTSPSAPTRLPSIQTRYNYLPETQQPIRRQSLEHQHQLQPPAIITPTKHSPPQVQNHKFIPISPQNKTKSKSDLLKSPPKQQSHPHNPRVCISCGSEQSPCWRPSWSIKEGQLCNSCGLRYKKTSARCLNKNCKKIPAKGEWSLMQSKGKITFEDGVIGHSCLECGWRVEVKKQ